jgi:glycerol uptake facilitator-like aquaporin
MKIQSKWAAVLAELVGTFSLTFAILAALKAQGGAMQLAQMNMLGHVETVPAFLLATPFVAAATLGILVVVLGNVSGAHINPAITLGLWTIKKIEAGRAVMYIVAQLAGAAIALLVAQYFVSSMSLDKFTGPGSLQLFLAEALGTMALGFGVAAAVLNNKSGHEAGILVGGSLFIGIVFAAFAAGAGILNPAVMVGLQSVSWSFILGPVVGAVAGIQLYSLLFNSTSKSVKAKK